MRNDQPAQTTKQIRLLTPFKYPQSTNHHFHIYTYIHLEKKKKDTITTPRSYKPIPFLHKRKNPSSLNNSTTPTEKKKGKRKKNEIIQT